MFLAAEFVLAVGHSMRSGSDSAMLYDSLKELTRETEYASIEGRGNQFARIGTGIASISGGLLAALSMRLPFWFNILTGLAYSPGFHDRAERKKASDKIPAEYPRIAAIDKIRLRPSSSARLIGSSASLPLGLLYVFSLLAPLALFGNFAAFQFSGALAPYFLCSGVKGGPLRLLQAPAHFAFFC